ncbi:MAG TPA: hypothetical protein VH308_06955 [Terracidiphilus sp.]|jgi:hypothetical protein|nr:hypothetical protein [Terracidiphilus sp.]
MRATWRGLKMMSVVAVLATACHSASNSASAAAGGTSAAQTAATSAPLSSQLTTATITDPTLNNARQSQPGRVGGRLALDSTEG